MQDSSPVLQGPPSPKLAGLQAMLERQVRGTLVDITGEINSRLVFGIGCIPMILIGIGLGILKRGGHLLSAFGASCVPGAVLIVAIISGKQVAGNTRWGEATPGDPDHVGRPGVPAPAGRHHLRPAPAADH